MEAVNGKQHLCTSARLTNCPLPEGETHQLEAMIPGIPMYPRGLSKQALQEKGSLHFLWALHTQVLFALHGSDCREAHPLS